MRLKRLTLHGYKSFAKRYEFVFPTAITAIVGPNGSGKSNIADAIRWALGEQSFRTLRGKSTEDMIFFGGQSRARAGMAEVALTVDNSDSVLPIDFTEVEISRRAYRSGENEYLINGARVRLRDVTELLAASGLAGRSYTVIGQGLVDAVLSLHSTERRALFEDAAGISLYRSKRDEALRRLEDTQHNLDRVRDILEEIRPRLGRLEREARRAGEYNEATAQLRTLQRTYYGYQWGAQQADLDQTKERHAALEDQAASLNSQAASNREKLMNTRNRESDLREALQESYAEISALHAKVDEGRRELAVVEERGRLLEARRQELVGELKPLLESRQRQEELVTEVAANCEALDRDLQLSCTRLSGSEKEWAEEKARLLEPVRLQEEMEKALRGLRNELEATSMSLLAARDEMAASAQRVADSEQQVRLLEARRNDLVLGTESLQETAADQAVRVQRIREEIESQMLEVERRNQDLSRPQTHSTSPEPVDSIKSSRRAAVQAAIEVTRGRIAGLRSSLGDVRTEEARLAGELDALAQYGGPIAGKHAKSQPSDLAALISDTLGSLTSLLQVPKEWETAIEAALGHELLALVVEHPPSLGELEHLTAGSGSAVTLLPLSGFSVNGDLPRGVKRALDVADCSERVRPAAERVLSCIALCEDFAQALELQSSLPSGCCCATRDGTVFRATGSVSVRSGYRGGQFAIQRARRESEDRMEEARRRCERLQADLENAVRKSTRLEAELQELDSELADARLLASRSRAEQEAQAHTQLAIAEQSLKNLEATLHREEALLGQGRGELESRRGQLAVLDKELEMATVSAEEQRLSAPAIHYLGTDSSKLESRQQKLTQEILELEHDLNELRQQASQVQEQAARTERERIGAARTQVAVAEEALRSQRQALDREKSLLGQLRARVDARQRRAEELDDGLADISVRIGQLKVEVQHLDRSLGEERARVESAEERLTETGDDLAGLREEDERLRERIRDTEDRKGRAQLELARCQDELNLLLRHIGEDLGLVEIDLAESVTAQSPLPLEPIVSQLAVVSELPQGLEDQVNRLKARLHRLANVNPGAVDEYEEVHERFHFLEDQAKDLEAASRNLRDIVAELDSVMKSSFKETFAAVGDNFTKNFALLFGGGDAYLDLTDSRDLLNSGIEVFARPPGKRAQPLSLFSGGERALTASALLFAFLQVSPTPFCVLDEVDAMLDEANISRFRTLLEMGASSTQFIVVTHNRGTVETADTIYGISMGSDGVSQTVSLKLE
jgi:chromosome segregation protein